MNNLRKFATEAEYSAATLNYPAVSWVVSGDTVHYDKEAPAPPPFDGKWLATYLDSHTESAQCDASSAITENEITKENLVSAEIGDCVTSIGDDAFADYSLTSLTIPDSVTSIGMGAFYYCTGLTSIVIPDSVTSIGQNAFNECHSLTSVTIGSGVTSIGDSVFEVCDNLTSIDIPDSVTSIGQNAFNECESLTSVTIGSGITLIETYAFGSDGNLTSVIIYATTPPTLGYYAFDSTNDCPIYVPASSVSAYQSAWSDYSSRIQAIPNN